MLGQINVFRMLAGTPVTPGHEQNVAMSCVSPPPVIRHFNITHCGSTHFTHQGTEDQRGEGIYP